MTVIGSNVENEIGWMEGHGIWITIRFVWLPIHTQLKEKYIVLVIIVYMESRQYVSHREFFIHPYSSGKLYVFEIMDGIQNDAKYSSV
jgi:hypothetical protein